MEWSCLLPANQYACVDKLTPHALEAWTLVITFDALVVALVPIVLTLLQSVFRIPTWSLIGNAFSYLSSLRLVHRNQLEVPTTNVASSESPFTPERSRPQWAVSVEPLQTGRISIPSKFIGLRRIFDIPIYVTNISDRSSPQFRLSLHFRQGLVVFEIFVFGTVSADKRKSELSSTSGGFWEAVVLSEPSPADPGTDSKVAVVRLSPIREGILDVDVPWLVRYGPNEQYPPDKYGKLLLRLDASTPRPD